MKTDIEIAQEATMRPIIEIARDIGLKDDEIELFGNYKCKVDLDVIDRLQGNEDAKLVLVTAITPTPMGEGKTTVSTSTACASLHWVPCSGSREVPLAVGMPRSCRWRTSTSTSPATSTR